MNVVKELSDFRSNVKVSINNLIMDIYKSEHNGQMPDFDSDEEFVVDHSKDKDDLHVYITMDEGNTYDDRISPMAVCIDRFIVTLDYNLYLYSNEDDYDCDWTEISTDDLVKIWNLLSNYYKTIK
jgi:hypothetical protein